ncbi:peptide chain release factor 2 [Candidatus Saccharibacteria bacterium]|nr:MAG: peptide chain release factor 2 [Candidatus Saccharibacteria bacterium]
MEELQKQYQVLKQDYDRAVSKLHIETLASELADLDAQALAPDFWSDAAKAQEIVKQQAGIKNRIEPWQLLGKKLQETGELIELQDQTLLNDLQKQLTECQQDFDQLKSVLRFSGKYDDHDAVLTLSAGAGGTDAQDWTAMLLRMYSRWAEQQKLQVTLLDEAAGDEAGLKRATLEISGSFVYGKLAGEAGVHRLVRLSPFNSDNLRQTSFAKAEVMPKIDSPNELEIDAKELKIDVYRAGGHGGQSVNTTDSAVRITHIPTGVSVAIQNERSQLQNKETAMTILRSRLAAMQLEQHQEHLSELKGPNQSAEWGNQIRSYVLHPYKQVKDLRTRHETSDAEGVLDGNLDPFIDAYLEQNLGAE